MKLKFYLLEIINFIEIHFWESFRILYTSLVNMFLSFFCHEISFIYFYIFLFLIIYLFCLNKHFPFSSILIAQMNTKQNKINKLSSFFSRKNFFFTSVVLLFYCSIMNNNYNVGFFSFHSFEVNYGGKIRWMKIFHLFFVCLFSINYDTTQQQQKSKISYSLSVSYLFVYLFTNTK